MRPDLDSANEGASPPNGNFVHPNGPRVRELRQERGWTQEDLKNRVGCSKRTIENIEAGRRTRRNTLGEVAEALGVEPERITVPRSDQPTVSVSGGSGQGTLGPVTGADTAARDTWTSRTGPHTLQPPHTPAPPPPKCSVLVVDDEPSILDLLGRLLAPEFEVLTAGHAAAAQTVFESRPIDIVLTDQQMPGCTGVQLLEWVHQHHPRTIRLLMTGYAEIEDAVEAINRGHVYYYAAKPFRPLGTLLHVVRNAAEKFRLERSRDQLLQKLRRSRRKLQKANQRLRQQLERLATTDPLTGLYNSRAIEELAHVELKRRIRYPRPLSLALIDVDQAESLTTEPLRSGSDEVLERLARILAGSRRKVDSIGRLHGGRFLAIVPETGTEGAARLAERMRAAVAAAPFTCTGQVVPITVSIGVAVADAGVHADFQDMTAVAAAALDDARKAGGNRWEVRRLPRPVTESV